MSRTRPGCTASDYDGLPVTGAVVLVDRGKCPFGDKQAVAAERGAVALIVANNDDGDEMGGTLGEKTDVKIPVISVTKAAGERLRAASGPHHSSSSTPGVRDERTRNVIAQTKTGSTADVVMVGRAPRQRARRALASTTTVRAWRRCWKPRCSWAVRRR